MKRILSHSSAMRVGLAHFRAGARTRLQTFCVWIALGALCVASPPKLVSDELVERISIGIRDAQLASSRIESPEREAVRRRTLDGLSDVERLRGIAEWMFTQPNRDHASIPSTALTILLSPKREIRDLSEWRRLMNLETDSSRFYMLAELSRYFEAPMFGYGESFMVERARGLLMQGVAAKEGQGQTEHRLSDISLYTYDTIVSDLWKIDSPFTKDILPTLEGKPEAAKVAELARWMKANWPGCEDLAVREKDGERPDRKFSANASKTGGTDTKTDREAGDESAVDASEDGPPMLAIVGSCILVAVAGVFFFLRRGRTA